MGWLHNWRAAFEQSVKQQITGLGLMFTLAVVLVGFAAFLSANNLLFLLLSALLATLLISGFVSRLGLAGLELRVLVPDHIAARRRLAGRIVLRNVKTVMPSFSIRLTGAPGSGLLSEIYFPVIPGGATVEEAAEIRFERRGLHRENTFHLHSRFPFGFTERRASVTLDRDLIVYPSVDAPPGCELLMADLIGEIESRIRGQGGDFYRLRPYEAFESARHVDWKATAHTGSLQIREFAREQDRTVSIFLDLEETADAGWFELAVECCAHLAWELAQREARVRFFTQRFERTVPDQADVYTILKYLALVTTARSLPIPQPYADRSSHIAFTARVDDLASHGWSRAHVLGPGDLGAGAGSSADSGDRTGEELHHGGRTHRSRGPGGRFGAR